MSNNKNFYPLCIISIALIFSACDNSAKKESPMQNKNEETQVGYYFELTDKEIFAYVEKAKSISINDSVEKVKAILGEPTLDDKLIGKKGEFVARVLDYYMKRWRENEVNEIHDKVISFYFDKDDLLYKISSNVEGVELRTR